MEIIMTVELPHFWNKTSKLLLAISGGVDSMVLLDLYIQLKNRPRALVAYVNHGIRQEAYKDIQLIQNVCRREGIPFVTNEDIPTLLSEDEARTYRYGFLKKIVQEHQCTHLVTAHHLDDQVETIMMKLVRGSSLESLVGMQQVRFFTENCQLVRPLLLYGKEMLMDYAKNHRIDYLEDSTNHSDAYTRNRFRHHILPLLKKENHQFSKHIEDFSKELIDVLQIANEHIVHTYEHVVQKNCIQGETFRTLPTYLQKQIIVKWLRQHQLVTKSAIEDVLNLLNHTAGEKVCDLKNGWQCVNRYGNGFLERKTNHQYKALNMTEDDTVDIQDYCLYVSDSTEHAICPVSIDDLPLTIRTRQTGDKMCLGTFSKKINRIFIDEKIPKSERDSIYLIVNKKNDVLAILDERCQRLSNFRETGKISERYIIYRKREKS
ncbi:tRNA lysidine(34) synthetase TilS [Granulicatella sp. zg-84]|nr:tRNA lysidine(34) synthetase TilS [Granulicatella sp. zg-84]